jgi:gluconolactonase
MLQPIASRRAVIAVAMGLGAGGGGPSPYVVMAGGLAFPEGPVALDDGSVLLVEIARGALTRVGADGRSEVLVQLGGGPNGAAIGPDGACYIANDGGLDMVQRDGLWQIQGAPADYRGGWIERVDLGSRRAVRLYEGIGERRLKAPNDLVFDGWGGFWFTDSGKAYARSRDHGGLYWARPDGSEIREVVYPLLTPNGVALSPDRRTVYVALTEKRQVVAYDLTGPGEVSGDASGPRGRVVASIGGDLTFDSMAVEAGGNLVVATVRAGRLTVLTRAGQVVETVSLPDFAVTNLAFGGHDMRTCYVTLSQTGRLVRLSWPRPGLKLLYR